MRHNIRRGIIGVLLIFCLVRVYYVLTDDFRMSNIHYEMPHHKEWEIEPLAKDQNDALDGILEKEFHYIGKGAQSYVFESEDHDYVIKFFKFKHLKPSLFVSMLPSLGPLKEFKAKTEKRKQRKLLGAFEGYHLAYQCHKDESGLIYVHLNRTEDLKRHCIVRDKMGMRHQIDLDQVVFVLQKKVKTTRTVLKELCAQRDPLTTKDRISQIFDLYSQEYLKGIVDHDHGVLHNTGFSLDYSPIHLDVGKMHAEPTISEPANMEEDFAKIGAKFQIWFQKNWPENAPDFTQHMEEEISRHLGHPFRFS